MPGAGPTLQVRQATAGDLTAVLGLVDALIREDAGAHDDHANHEWARREGPDFVTALIADPRRLALLAERRGRAVGVLLANVLDPTPFGPEPVARLGSLFVVQGDRGSGVGGALVSAFWDWAAQMEVGLAQVTAYAANTRAIAFYQRHGLAPHELTLRGQVHPVSPHGVWPVAAGPVSGGSARATRGDRRARRRPRRRR